MTARRFASVAVLAAVIAPLALSGCSTISRIFASDDDRLPGSRTPVVIEPGSAANRLGGNPVVLAQPVNAGAWAQPGGNAQHNAGHQVADRSLDIRWTTDIGRGNTRSKSIVGQPIIVSNTVFVYDSDSTVSALSLSNGGKLWERSVRPTYERTGYFGGGVSFENGLLFVATGFGELRALRARDGRTVWRRYLGSPARSAPTVSQGRLFVQTVDGKVRAVDAASGQPVWSHDGPFEQTRIIGTASPAVSGNIVVVGYESGDVEALSAITGEVIWKDAVATVGAAGLANDLTSVKALPIIADNTVYVTTNAGRTVAFNLTRGGTIWETPVGSNHTPVVSGSHIFLTSTDARIMAIDRSNGLVTWQRQLDGTEERRLSANRPITWYGPVLAGGRLLVASSKSELLQFRAQDGRAIRRQNLNGGTTVDPVTANGYVLFLTDKARLTALR